MELNARQKEQYEAVKNYVEHPGRSKQRIAAKFGVSERTVERWIAKYKKDKKVAFVHGNNGKEPKRKIPQATRDRIVQLYQSEKYTGCNLKFFTELLNEREHIPVSEQSVRNILAEAGIYAPRQWKSTKKRLREEAKQKAKAAVANTQTDSPEGQEPAGQSCNPIPKNKIAPEDGHSTKERCKYFGETIQMDASSYKWFGDIVTHLHVAVDESQSRCLALYFDTEETLNGYYHCLKTILLNYGIPVQFLTDRRTVFEYKKKENPDLEEDTFTQFSYACKRLGIDISTTSVAEKKGLVEKYNDTLQQRLPIIFRLEGITTIEAANEFISAHLDELINDKFALPLDSTKSVFETQFGGKEFDEETVNLICSVLTPRSLSAQCIRYNNKTYKLLDENGIQQNYRDHTKVTVIRTLDAQLYATVKGDDQRLLKLEEVKLHVEKSKNIDADYIQPQPHKVHIPALDHPWRYSEFLKHANEQRHRVEMNCKDEDPELSQMLENIEHGFVIMGHQLA